MNEIAQSLTPIEKATVARSLQSQERKAWFIKCIAAGDSIDQALAHPEVASAYGTYKKWRQLDKKFAAKVDVARSAASECGPDLLGTHAEFAKTYFGMQYAWFQLEYINLLEQVPPGGILMALWPPEHGKTTTYENYASETLARFPEKRLSVASENLRIAQKIIGRIKHRMEPAGPYPYYVEKWGPFKPDTGQSKDNKQAQPWGAGYFNVKKKDTQDERDYSMIALGWKSSIVSTRTDHLHVDDVQSTKTYTQTDKIEEWFRQDALSRPGEHGITTIAGTRVGEDDFYERLANDPDLHDILKVVKFKAISTNAITGEQEALWPERYNLDQLDRQRRKVGQDAWDRNYMQNPGANPLNRTFSDDMIDSCKDPMISLEHAIPNGHIVYVGLDPALGGQNCVIAAEVSPKGKLIIRRIREQTGLRTNEQIMQELNSVIASCNVTGRVSDVVIETMNFQKGLARDERLLDMQRHYGFAMREHLTGWNKYDEDVGVPSMCESFLRGEIVIPWADDPTTRNEMEELCRQLRAWKPGKRGTKLRQDRVMALWFIWILWRQRWKSDEAGRMNADGWKTKGLPWGGTKAGLVLPIGVRL